MRAQQQRSSPQIIRSREKAQQCLDMRIAGASWTQIGARGPYAGKGQAHRAVMALLDEKEEEMAETLRKVVNMRLDSALLAIWPRVQRGDLGAIGRMLQIEAQRARLYGIEAPARTEITGADGGPIEVVELEQFVARLAALPPAGADSISVVELFPDREAAP